MSAELTVTGRPAPAGRGLAGEPDGEGPAGAGVPGGGPHPGVRRPRQDVCGPGPAFPVEIFLVAAGSGRADLDAEMDAEMDADRGEGHRSGPRAAPEFELGAPAGPELDVDPVPGPLRGAVLTQVLACGASEFVLDDIQGVPAGAGFHRHVPRGGDPAGWG